MHRFSYFCLKKPKKRKEVPSPTLKWPTAVPHRPFSATQLERSFSDSPCSSTSPLRHSLARNSSFLSAQRRRFKKETETITYLLQFSFTMRGLLLHHEMKSLTTPKALLSFFLMIKFLLPRNIKIHGFSLTEFIIFFCLLILIKSHVISSRSFYVFFFCFVFLFCFVSIHPVHICLTFFQKTFLLRLFCAKCCLWKEEENLQDLFHSFRQLSSCSLSLLSFLFNGKKHVSMTTII